MNAVGNTRTVYSKETGIKREFSELQWQELGASGQAGWSTQAPPEAEGTSSQGSETATAAIESADEKQARLIAEAVAKALAGAGLTIQATAMTAQPAATPPTGTAVTDFNASKAQLTYGQTAEDVTKALTAAAADDTSTDADPSAVNKLDADEAVDSELAAARIRYEEAYPGQQAGRKRLQTLLDAVALKEGENK